MNGARPIVEMLVLDVDGVLTDGTKLYHADGTVSKRFHDHDSAGLQLLRKRGILLFVISEDARVNEPWAKHQGIPFVQSGDKRKALEELLQRGGVAPETVAFIGDDLRDMEAMDLVRYPMAPLNAAREIRELCERKPSGVLLERRGGNGAVREAAEGILAATV